MKEKLALASILLALTGCLAEGTYRLVEPATQTIAVAVSTMVGMGISHPKYVGQELLLYIRGRKVPVRIERLLPNGKFEFVGIHEDLEFIERGDTGSMVGMLLEKYDARKANKTRVWKLVAPGG